jgi:predicted alpha/beta hydrolase family esterase
MKNAIIIHGLPDDKEYYDVTHPAPSNQHWLPWIQKQLIIRDILAQTPEMPVPYNPEYQAWKKVFGGFEINEDTILIGHSAGAGFIVRYLSEHDIHVGNVALVGPWLDPDKSLESGMLDFTIDQNIAAKTKRITVFYSTDDGQEVLDSAEALNLPGVIMKKFTDKGHFIHDDMDTDEFPELIEAVI